jgi:hypothetical protein
MSISKVRNITQLTGKELSSLSVTRHFVSGSFMDATGSYDASFYLSGSLILVSAILCYPLKRLNAWEMGKSETMAPADV